MPDRDPDLLKLFLPGPVKRSESNKIIALFCWTGLSTTSQQNNSTRKTTMKRPVIITLLVAALALVCLGIGAVIFFGFNNGFPGNNPFDQRNFSSELEERKTLKIDAEKPINLNVIDDAGSVTVTGADVQEVQ